jgi:hypothetical protein
MAWQSYSLDQVAQRLVLDARQRDRQSLNQSFKMREAVAYGLERFWGEHLRLQAKDAHKSLYWQETWNALAEVMSQTGVIVPNQRVNVDDPAAVKQMAERLWSLPLDDQRLILAVLTQLCDCIVWWTQRYKGTRELENEDGE